MEQCWDPRPPECALPLPRDCSADLHFLSRVRIRHCFLGLSSVRRTVVFPWRPGILSAEGLLFAVEVHGRECSFPLFLTCSTLPLVQKHRKHQKLGANQTSSLEFGTQVLPKVVWHLRKWLCEHGKYLTHLKISFLLYGTGTLGDFFALI